MWRRARGGAPCASPRRHGEQSSSRAIPIGAVLADLERFAEETLSITRRFTRTATFRRSRWRRPAFNSAWCGESSGQCRTRNLPQSGIDRNCVLAGRCEGACAHDQTPSGGCGGATRASALQQRFGGTRAPCAVLIAQVRFEEAKAANPGRRDASFWRRALPLRLRRVDGFADAADTRHYYVHVARFLHEH